MSLRVVIALATLSAVILAARADEFVRHRGRCQSLTILDRPASLQCDNEMIEQAGPGDAAWCSTAPISPCFTQAGIKLGMRRAPVLYR